MTKPAPKNARALTLKELGIDAKAAKAAVEAVAKDVEAKALKALPKDATDEAKADAIAAALAEIRIPAAIMFGSITQVKDELRQDGTVGSALIGAFEGHNKLNAAAPVVSAARLYLPNVQETVETDFRQMPASVRGQRMDVQANIYIIHADNKYGYNYEVSLPLRDTTNDPLAALRGKLAEI